MVYFGIILLLAALLVSPTLLFVKKRPQKLNTIFKGAVLLSYIPDKGYFIHTPNDYHLASEYYSSPEDIPQNLINTMADLYEQYKQRGENHE